jgi:transposase, IS30 family
MTYKHLTQEERYHIYESRAIGKSLRQIARELQRDHSAISREIKRNKGERGYRPNQAHKLACERAQRRANGPRIDPEVWAAAQLCLEEKWSPQQIAGRFKILHIGKICHESIYQRLLLDKKFGGTIYTNLRGQKKRRKRYGSGRDRRGHIIGRISIHERPKIVEQKVRLGDWEGDTVIGAAHKQAIVSVVERSTQYVLLKKVERKTSDAVKDSLIELMEPYENAIHTLTLDNGKEFADHAEVSQKLGTAVYFADPYSSWQRGLNEQVNGLVRQYFPKKKNFSTITQQEVFYVAHKLNNRPRKLLGYRTPQEAFFESAKQQGVALRV